MKYYYVDPSKQAEILTKNIIGLRAKIKELKFKSLGYTPNDSYAIQIRKYRKVIKNAKQELKKLGFKYDCNKKDFKNAN